MDELKRVNSMLTLVNNIATVVGPLVGGAIALVAPTDGVSFYGGVHRARLHTRIWPAGAADAGG